MHQTYHAVTVTGCFIIQKISLLLAPLIHILGHYFRMLVATPVDWKVGGDCMVLPGVQQDEAIEMFPKGLKTHAVPSGKVNMW